MQKSTNPKTHSKKDLSQPAQGLKNLNEMGDNPNDLSSTYQDSNIYANSEDYTDYDQPIMKPYEDPTTNSPK